LKAVVLQLIDSFNQGGSERQAVQLTRLLHESRQFHVRLACLNPEGLLRKEIDALNLGEVPAYPLTSFYDRNAVKQIRHFVSWLKESKVDIIHAHDFYTNIFGMTAGAIARVPVRIASRRETAGMRTGMQKRAQQLGYSLAHKIVGNSEAVKRVLIEESVPEKKIVVVHNGLDLVRLAPPGDLSRHELLSQLGVKSGSQNPQFVTILANMRHDVKDYPMFLNAARIVSRSVPDAEFLLAGEGELTDSLRALAKELGIEPRTHFLGRCENVGALLMASDVCVLSSKAEGFSNSILEYMAAGRPVVATNVGGAAEAIVEGKTGFLVTTGDYQTMAERIVSLLRNPEDARKMGQLGREIVEAKFSCEAQLLNTERLYETLLVTAHARTGTTRGVQPQLNQ
jgi:glycosyltransferase involved in cell wall biosynthesis